MQAGDVESMRAAVEESMRAAVEQQIRREQELRAQLDQLVTTTRDWAPIQAANDVLLKQQPYPAPQCDPHIELPPLRFE